MLNITDKANIIMLSLLLNISSKSDNRKAYTSMIGFDIVSYGAIPFHTIYYTKQSLAHGHFTIIIPLFIETSIQYRVYVCRPD